jgi:hypothetical protein
MNISHMIEHIYTLHNLPFSMASIRCFDDLPDLFFIELFNYLSPIDILWSFINLNNRIQAIISERGFFRHINLSSARLSKFDTLLTLLLLNRIETLVIDIEASPLQLSRYPYLPRLTTLRLYGLRDFEDAYSFIVRQLHSLTHLTLETSDLFLSVCTIRDYLQTALL